MRKQLVLVKLGGSLITDKRTPMTFRQGQVADLANAFSQLRRTPEGIDFLLGTGAGSFGHFSAHHYGLRHGAQTDEQRYGMCITHNAVQKLCGMVAEEFTRKNVPVFVTSPSSLFACADGQVTSSHVLPLQNLLASGLIPVVHGDTVTDSVRGATIMSTEKVFQACLEQLHAHYEKITVIYLLDVDGVLDANGDTIPEFTMSDEVIVSGSLAHDTTGGITGKVESARSALQYANAVYLINGKMPGAIQRALAGERVGTRIVR